MDSSWGAGAYGTHLPAPPVHGVMEPLALSERDAAGITRAWHKGFKVKQQPRAWRTPQVHPKHKHVHINRSAMENVSSDRKHLRFAERSNKTQLEIDQDGTLIV